MGKRRKTKDVSGIGEEGESEEELEGEESGARKTMKKLDPKMPSDGERREHELTHLPYRSWCRHCVRGRGKEEPCRRGAGEEGGLPEFHVDYMFMGEEKGEKTLAILVARMKETKAVMSTVVPKKSYGIWAARRLMAWMREVGHAHGDVIVKSDNEPALGSLVEAWSRLRKAEGGCCDVKCWLR